MANWDPELYTEVKAPPTVTCETKPDDEVRRYFPSLDALVREMSGRTAKDYVKSLSDAGHQVQRAPEGDAKLDNVISIIPRASTFSQALLSTFQRLQKENGSNCIQTNTARYTYNQGPADDDFFLRMEPSTQGPDGPCAIVFQSEDRNRSLIVCDPTSKMCFWEFRLDDGSFQSRLIRVDEFEHPYTGGTYFIQPKDNMTDQAQDAPVQCDTVHDAFTTK